LSLHPRLWGRPKLTFVSEVEEPDKTPQTMGVDLGIPEKKGQVRTEKREVRLEDYAAVIMAANYTSVRLRYDHAPFNETVRDNPAVDLFARAMGNPEIVKGALCHGLWILTPRPELLAGRRVLCHEVVRCDVENAGGHLHGLAHRRRGEWRPGHRTVPPGGRGDGRCDQGPYPRPAE
jgi:protease I